MIVIIEPAAFTVGGETVETTGDVVSAVAPQVFGSGGTCEVSFPIVIAKNPGAQLTP